jgi:hypothetical protein
MLMAEADGSNDKRASFSAILKLVGGPLLSLTDAIPDELSATAKGLEEIKGDLLQADFGQCQLESRWSGITSRLPAIRVQHRHCRCRLLPLGLLLSNQIEFTFETYTANERTD